MKKFKCRINNTEIRSCNKNLLQGGKHNKIEIIKWYKKTDDEESCYTTEVYERTWKR